MSLRTLLLTGFLSLALASSTTWNLSNGRATLSRRGDAESSSISFSPSSPLISPLPLPPSATLKLSFTLKDGRTASRPHQAFLLLRDPTTDIETFYPLTVKPSSGKASVSLTQRDVSPHLLTAEMLDFAVVLGSFGETDGAVVELGKIQPFVDPASLGQLEKMKMGDGGEVRYAKKEELRHTFREGDKSPAIAVTLAFAGAVVAALVGLIGLWFGVLGANFGQLGKAVKTAPVSHILFFGSLVVLEGIFVLYYTCWNLFQTLGAAGIVGTVAFFSGSRALTEVSARRERGER